MNIRTETPADHVASVQVTRLAFTSTDGIRENELIAEIRASDRLVPELSLPELSLPEPSLVAARGEAVWDLLIFRGQPPPPP